MEQIIRKIKKSNHWRILIRPTIFEETRVSNRNTCLEIIENNRILLRGLDFPHFDRNKIKKFKEGIHCGIDFHNIFHIIEYWKFWQSGQFILLKTFDEEFIDDYNIKNFLSITRTIYQITEVFEFSRRLILQDILIPSLEISITLSGVQDRTLIYEDNRILIHEYKCDYGKIIHNKEYNSRDFLVNTHDYSLDFIIYIFKQFYWDSVSMSIIKEIQRNFLNK